MAKKSAVEKNNRRMRIVAAKGARRDNLRAIMRDKSISMEERFAASCKLAQEPRDSARSRIRNDAYQGLRPPCNGRLTRTCDHYADVYLDGNPDDGNFEGGDQGFNSVLEETLQYVNSLATGYAFEDFYRGSRSERDGILTFLWYLERYLRMARLDYPDAYDHISGNECWRRSILQVWGRAWMYLSLTDGSERLGISDDAILNLVTEPELLEEISRIRQIEGCMP